ncbi:hypothetical protein AAG570_013775 [Ranatra chinensis]|uniref:Uncharacterized protein n=1 Tax=Ranatra chinensis TaxID=642074 RepID=A0ABD0YDF3_9HEMI
MVLDMRLKRKQLKDTVNEMPTSNKFEALSSSPDNWRIVREKQPKKNIPHSYVFIGEKRKKWLIHNLTASASAGEILEDIRQTIPGAIQVVHWPQSSAHKV